MAGGGGGQTVNNDPWEGQQPYLTNLFDAANQLYSSGIGQNYYPGETVAPFSDPTMQGFDALMARGGGTPAQDAYGMFLGDTMGNNAAMPMAATAHGAFLGGNPFLDSVYDASARKMTESFNEEIMPGLNATFGDASRTGSGIHALMATDLAGDMTDSLGDLASSIYAPAYETERDRMVQAGDILGGNAVRAGAMMPSYDTMQRTNIQDVLNVGGAMEDQTQRLMDADIARFNFGQQAPWDVLGQYANTIYGMPSGYGTTETDGSGSRLAGGVGGAMAGAGLAGSVAALNPYMWPMMIGGGLLGMWE